MKKILVSKKNIVKYVNNVQIQDSLTFPSSYKNPPAPEKGRQPVQLQLPVRSPSLIVHTIKPMIHCSIERSTAVYKTIKRILRCSNYDKGVDFHSYVSAAAAVIHFHDNRLA